MADQADGGKNDRGSGLGKWWWASAVVVLLVVAAAVWLAVDPAPSPSAARPTVTRTVGPSGAPVAPPSTSVSSGSTSSSANVPGAWADRGCNGSSGSSARPAAAPGGVTWMPLGAMSVPTSPTLGPAKVTAPYRECFQHSPAGALLAAVNIQDAAGANLQTAVKVLQHQVTAGPGRDSAIAAATGPDAAVGYASPIGFQFGACSPTSCIVNVVFSGGGSAEEFTDLMVWSGGDWKLNGTNIPEPSLVQGLPSGFIPWSAAGGAS